MCNATFVIGTKSKQVWLLEDIGDSELRWLRAFSKGIKSSSVLIGMENIVGLNFGTFSYTRFRKFMRSTGYSDIIAQTDRLYRITA